MTKFAQKNWPRACPKCKISELRSFFIRTQGEETQKLSKLANFAKNCPIWEKLQKKALVFPLLPCGSCLCCRNSLHLQFSSSCKNNAENKKKCRTIAGKIQELRGQFSPVICADRNALNLEASRRSPQKNIAVFTIVLAKTLVNTFFWRTQFIWRTQVNTKKIGHR